MNYDPKVVKYKLNCSVLKQNTADLFKVMEEIEEYRYTAICDYLYKLNITSSDGDVDMILKKYYPSKNEEISFYLASYFFIAYYFYKRRERPEFVIECINKALKSDYTYNCASALLCMCFLNGFGVKQDKEKARKIQLNARKHLDEINMPLYELYPLNVYSIDI